jgi:hypothetical protein
MGSEEKCVPCFGAIIRRAGLHGWSRLRWKDNIKVHIKAVRWEGVDRFMLFNIRSNDGHFEDSNEPSGSIKYG